MIDGLVEHIEQHLGRISGGWSTDPNGHALGFQVAEIESGRIEDAVIYVTLGLSDYVLDSPIDDGAFRLELLMIAPEHLRGSALPFVLGDVGRMVAERRELPALGTVMRRNATLGGPSAMNALYVGRPLYFSPEFAVFQRDGLVVNVDWLMPVSTEEGEFIAEHGWQGFEKLMYADEGFDPVDFARPSLI